jgi:hypothetical protein
MHYLRWKFDATGKDNIGGVSKEEVAEAGRKSSP